MKHKIHTLIFYLLLAVLAGFPAIAQTPNPSTDEVGTVWFVPENRTHIMYDLTFFNTGIPNMPELITPVILGSLTFTTTLHVNTGTQPLGAYNFTLNFDKTVVIPNTQKGVNGVSADTDGFLTLADASTPGKLVINGIDATGKGPGTDLHLLILNWLAQSYSGTTTVSTTIDTLQDTTGRAIGTPGSRIGTITIKIFTCKLGDIDYDNTVTIVDALRIAQYAVGIITSSIDLKCGDVNCDGQINIIDALILAQYIVGLLPSLGC